MPRAAAIAAVLKRPSGPLMPDVTSFDLLMRTSKYLHVLCTKIGGGSVQSMEKCTSYCTYFPRSIPRARKSPHQ